MIRLPKTWVEALVRTTRVVYKWTSLKCLLCEQPVQKQWLMTLDFILCGANLKTVWETDLWAGKATLPKPSWPFDYSDPVTFFEQTSFPKHFYPPTTTAYHFQRTREKKKSCHLNLILGVHNNNTRSWQKIHWERLVYANVTIYDSNINGAEKRYSDLIPSHYSTHTLSGRHTIPLYRMLCRFGEGMLHQLLHPPILPQPNQLIINVSPDYSLWSFGT